MTLITDLPLVPAYDGTEEFVVQKGATEYKVVGSSITSTVATDLANYIVSNDIAVAANTTGKLSLSGGTMTGYITLHADPVAAFQPTTKQYVDAALALKVDSTGGTIDGTATGVTAADTTENTTMATTEYVANKLEYEVLKKTNIASTPVNLAYADRGTVTVAHTATAPVILNLPEISALSPNEERTEYYIVDTGLNAEANTITINAFAGDTINGSSSFVLNSDGASVVLATRGSNSWFVKDQVAGATATAAGVIEIASTAEATALTSTTLAVTPGTLGDVVDDRLYKFEEIGAATENVVEADAGTIYYVTYTSTGIVTVNLPDPGTLANSGRFVIEVWDAGDASTNNITIAPAAGTIDGSATVAISDIRSGMKIFTDGVNYFTIANTSRATAAASSTTTLSGVLGVGNTTGANNISVDSGQDIRFNNGGFTARILEPTLASDQTYTLPATGGTLATDGTVLQLAGGTMTGNITMATTTQIAFSDGTFTGSFAEATGMASNVVYTLPDVTGTIALTSDITTQLASYLPLSGGTITGVVTFTGAGDIRGNGLFDPLYGTGMLMSSSTSGEVATAASTEWKTNFLRQKVTGLDVGIEQGTGFSADPSTAVSITSTDGTSTSSGNNSKLAGLFLNARGGTAQTATTNNVFLGGDGSHTATATTNGNTFVMGTMYQKDLCINDNVLAHSAATAAIPVTHQRVDLTSTTTNACTLANGVTGQRITLVYVAEAAGGDTITITPASLNGYSTITLNDLGDTVELEYGTGGWSIISVFNAIIA